MGFRLKMDSDDFWNPATDRTPTWDNWPTDIPVAGDWNGDGKTETGVYRGYPVNPSGAGFYLKMDNTST